jgi:hypothetical protein
MNQYHPRGLLRLQDRPIWWVRYRPKWTRLVDTKDKLECATRPGVMDPVSTGIGGGWRMKRKRFAVWMTSFSSFERGARGVERRR